MMYFALYINKLPIESLYGPIEDLWGIFAFAAPPLRAILVNVNNRPKSTDNRKADDECAAGRKAVLYHYQTAHATGYDANSLRSRRSDHTDRYSEHWP